jgi:opacity protein-like surface antigen
MKKIFLAAVTALALCSYSYAQDDEDEYEEEEAPARVVKEAPAPAPSNWDDDEDEAPAAKKADKKKAAKKTASESGNGFFGIGLDLTGMLARSNAINLTFRLNDAMMLSAIFGFQHYGETTVSAGGQDQDLGDDATVLSVGAAFDYIVVQKFIPFSIGGEFIYTSLPDGAGPDAVANMAATESNSQIDFGVMAGLHGEIVPNLVLTGKAGLEFSYMFGEVTGGNADYGKFDFGLKYRVYLTWFAF